MNDNHGWMDGWCYMVHYLYLILNRVGANLLCGREAKCYLKQSSNSKHLLFIITSQQAWLPIANHKIIHLIIIIHRHTYHIFCCAGQQSCKNHAWSFIKAMAANLDLLERLTNYLQLSFRSFSQILDLKLPKTANMQVYPTKAVKCCFCHYSQITQAKIMKLDQQLGMIFIYQTPFITTLRSWNKIHEMTATDKVIPQLHTSTTYN